MHSLKSIGYKLSRPTTHLHCVLQSLNIKMFLIKALMSVNEKDETEASLHLYKLIKFHLKDMYTVCVWCLCTTGGTSMQTHTQTHTNKSLDETPRTQSRDLIPSLSYLCIGQVPQCVIRRKKGEKHKAGRNMCLLKLSFFLELALA